MAAEKLKAYRAKRDFPKTTEPRGKVSKVRARKRRFVVQKHSARRLHYDFRLEIDGVFKSWAVTRGPSFDPRDRRLAVEVEDHPLAYGDFEGTIPKGQYGGGTVMIWDRGYWAPLEGTSPMRGLKAGELAIRLMGKKLKGAWVLIRLSNRKDRAARKNWLLIKMKDRFAQPGAGDRLLAHDRSVASGRTMRQIAAHAPPGARAFIGRSL